MIPVEKPGAKKRRGGARDGAGRKRSVVNRCDPSHAKREELDCRWPVHTMLRTCKDVPRLRQRRMYEAIRSVLTRYVEGVNFRVVHISLQWNHIHLIVEAKDQECLSRGMQSFAINAARAINAAARRKGKVFQFRYKSKQLRSRDYARNAIAYVLNNWRRHREDVRDSRPVGGPFDPFSSAVSFDGWYGSHEWSHPPWDGYVPLAVSAPRTGLLRSSWKWRGLIDPYEVPGTLQS